MTLNKERNWAFIGVGLWIKISFMSTYLSEQHIFSISSSILAFNLSDLQVLFCLAFGGKKIGYFEGWGRVQIVLASTNIVQ